MSEQNYEMKPGLSYIDERNKQFRYADADGQLQWIHPLSRYKAFEEIKRGEAVSVVTKAELLSRAESVNSIEHPIIKTFTASENTGKQTYTTETMEDGVAYRKYERKVYELTEADYKYVTVVEIYYNNSMVDGKVSHVISNTVATVYTNGDCDVKASFPVTSTKTVKYSSQTDVTNDEWNDDDNITITTTLTWDSENYSIIRQYDAYNQTTVDEIMADPDPYVVKTDTAVHERTIGLALEYASGYGEEIHIQPYGKFTFDPTYEGKNTDFYGADNENHEAFDHTGKEYNPGFTYEDVGKKVYISYKAIDDSCGHLTIDAEKVSKYYHNIICLGYLTDAPQVAGEGKTEIEISISGDQRGLLEATQIEARLGEDVAISENDPIRVFAYGKEDDTTFKARLCLTPQAGSFADTDFIAFQKMDGSTAIIYFNGTEFNINGVVDDDDKAFLHMANCYANVSGTSIGTYKVNGFNDTQTVEAINNNISKLYDTSESINVLSDAFKYVAGYGLSIKTFADTTNPFGYIDLEALEVGGYYVMYVSSGLKNKFDGSITECHGSYENHGLAVLADVRIPERRDVLGIYYGTRWNETIEKGYTTVFMRLGEFDVPENSSQFDGNFIPGQEYYLGTNGRVCKFPYNQFDCVNKIGTIKYSNDDDLRFVVDIGESTRHYNGDLPVGYMKPAIYTGSGYINEYGFVLMDGTTKYSKDAPYDALYERLLGWFSSTDVEVSGDTDSFRVPAVNRMVPQEVLENGVTVTKQVQVPMQIKYLASGIYEEMPRIPFKRFFGQFADDSSVKVDDDWTPVKCQIEDCDITDIIDYGISEDGYTKPGLDNLDVHLFIDPNENYTSGAHDWHEVHEGFFNWNNSTTFGYTWKIIEEEATEQHPYGCYKLSMVIGNSEGVAYVTPDNQAPKKLNNCYYKLYVARREVFSRQFDIEKIYKDYLTNSVYTDDAKSEVVLTKAVTGKAVIDAIENRYHVNTFIANEDATIALGELTKPVGSLILDTKSSLPIIAQSGVYIQNEEDNTALASDKQAPKVTFIDGVLAKGGAYSDTSVLKTTGTEANAEYVVSGKEIPTVKQIRDHATATIDNKDYAYNNYDQKDNSSGAIHGMIFGKDGNIDASTLWGIVPQASSDKSIASYTADNLYIPVVYKTNTSWEHVTEGVNTYRASVNGAQSDVMSEEIGYASVSNFTISTNGVTSGESINAITKSITLSKSNTLVTKYKQSDGILKAQVVLDTDDGSLKFLKMAGTSNNGGLAIYAGPVVSTSRSEYKRIYGELIRDTALVSDDDLADGSKKYDSSYNYEVKPEGDYDVVYKYAEDTNKFNSILGSALQAAYEMPLAYWQYNTEKEWYKDRLGIIVQRIESVAKNISGKTLASATIGSLIVTAKDYTEDIYKVELTRTDKTTGVVTLRLLVNDEEKLSVENLSTVGDVIEQCANDYVTFSGVEDAVLDLQDEDFRSGNAVTFTLEGGTTTGTTRKLFDNLTAQNETPIVTTPAVAASATIGDLVVTAKETGPDGNKISVSVVYTQDDAHYRITVANDTVSNTYSGKTVDEMHTLDSDNTNFISPDDPLVTFSKREGADGDGTFEETSNGAVYLEGGSDGEAVSRSLVNTNYKENTYTYTSDEASSIKEYLTTIIDNSSNGQDVLSSIGLLFNAAKETQERLLRIEASTFGRDYETIPGAHEPYVLSNMPGVVPDPTNYGLNRLIRALCQEIYYDSNPFDSALASGDSTNVSSFSRIDRLDREIHGELNTEDGTQTATNVLDSIDSTTYPYEDMIRAEDDTKVREAEYSTDETTAFAKERGTDVKTRVDMTLFDNDSNGNYTAESENNTQSDDGHFNGIVDAIYRITTKLNALTESINNSDNIADSPVRLNTIRQNIEHIIREAYFDDTYNINTSDPVADNGTSGEDRNFETFTATREDASPYHDLNGADNAPYTKSLSRFDKITDNLYNYVISVSGESLANFGDFHEFGDEKVIKQVPEMQEDGSVKMVDTEQQVYYTGRKFNGKHLLVDNVVTDKDGTDLDGTDVPYTADVHIPQNLNDYNYATLIDIVIDALGAEWFRKNVSKKTEKDDSYNNIEELRHNRTISTRLDNIEGCLDKVVRKLSRAHSFEEETDIIGNNNVKENVERTEGGSEVSNQTVFSIDRYIQFMNDYLGYYQTTDNDVTNSSSEDSKHYNTNYVEHWANGIDEGIEYYSEDGLVESHNLGLDGDPTADNFEENFGLSIGTNQYSAEWAFMNKKNIHAGLINTLARLQNREVWSNRIDAILGDEYASNQKAITTTMDKLGGDTNSVQTETSTSTYTLTDDIKDILLTIYGYDNHDSLQENDKGTFTSYTHRTLVENTNTNTRFVTGESGNNIIDIIINELYKLPRPIRPYDSEIDADTTKTIDEYFSNNAATGASITSDNIFIPTDNTITAHASANGTKIRDSRLAKYYDFEEGYNYYDIPDAEYALSWDNRDEFFNDTGRLKDAEVDDTNGRRHRYSRFEVIEEEIRHLRKLIGLDFKQWDGQEDLINLKFNGILKFFGSRVNNGFSGAPYSTDVGANGVVNSYTDQFNMGADNSTGAATTNILTFMLNSDKAERLLRAELGFSNNDWAKVKPEDKTSGYDYWYDYTYSTDGKKNKEALLSSDIKDGSKDYSEYGLFGQQTDETYENRHSVYDRLVALEQNAVRVDAWLDSVKNNYRTTGKGSGTGNIYDLVNYLGNYTWASTDNHYYGAFGLLDEQNLLIEDENVTNNKYSTVTEEINGHHEALIDIYNIIGTDEADDTQKAKYLGNDGQTNVRKYLKNQTIWARLNAVEDLNQNDIDITDVIYSYYSTDEATEGVIELCLSSIASMQSSNNVSTRMLGADDLAEAIDESLKTITSKGYVDNAINVAINAYHKYVGDRISSVVSIDYGVKTTNTTVDENGNTSATTIEILSDEKSASHNDITFKTKTNNETDYYNAATILGLKDAINTINGQTQEDINRLYKNLNAVMGALNYTYAEDPALYNSTIGSLLSWS